MKKLLALLLALIMLFAFAACGSDDKDTDVDDDVKGEITSTDKTSSEDTDSQSGEDKATIGIGQSTADKWENKALGLGFEAPEGWTFLTQEEINQNTQVTDDITDDDLKEILDDSGSYCDMMVSDGNGNSVSVYLQKFTGKAGEVEEYLDEIITGLEGTYDSMGATVSSIGKKDYTIGSKEYNCIKCSVQYMGVGMHQLQIYEIIDRHVAAITITVVGEDTTEDIIDKFYTI